MIYLLKNDSIFRRMKRNSDSPISSRTSDSNKEEDNVKQLLAKMTPDQIERLRKKIQQKPTIEKTQADENDYV